MVILPTSIPANFTVATNGSQNNTNGTNCQQRNITEWIVTVVPVYILLIAVLGIVCNVFVLMVFCFHKKACTVAEIYLSNLAAADLVLVSCLPFWAVNVSNGFNWPFGLFLCKTVNLAITMNMYCSIYFLVLVSIDRYVALVHTMSYGRMREPKYAKLGCLLVWGFGLLLSVPTLVFRTVKFECNFSSCYLNYPSQSVYILFESMLTMFSFIIPISIISYSTVKIIQTLNNRLNAKNMEHKPTTLVLAVLLAFLICWVPLHLLRMVKIFIGPNDAISQILIYLAFFNSVLNPILYVIVGQNFRKKAKELFKLQSSRVTFNDTSTNLNLMSSVQFVGVSR